MNKFYILCCIGAVLCSDPPLQNPIDKSEASNGPVNQIPIVMKTKVPSEDRVRRMAWFAAASACGDKKLESWKCIACKKVAEPPVKYHKSYYNHYKGTKAYITIVEANKEIIVGYRGGRSIQNAFGFLNMITVPFKPYCDEDGAEVHKGFKETMEGTVKPLVEDLRGLLEKYPDFKVIVVGHSFGAALASLGFVRIRHELQLPWERVELYTYGQMRNGNIKFAQWFDSKPTTCARGVNAGDKAARVFYKGIFQTFAHHGNEIWVGFNNKTDDYKVCRRDILEDPECNNSIPLNKLKTISHVHFLDTSFVELDIC